MKIIHISYSYDFTDGGITTVVKQIIKEQKKANLSVEWLASNQFSNPLRVEDFIKKIYEANPSIIHLHGLWRLHTRITSTFIQRGTPYIIAPHGITDLFHAKQNHYMKQLLSINIACASSSMFLSTIHDPYFILDASFFISSLIHFRHDMPKVFPSSNYISSFLLL